MKSAAVSKSAPAETAALRVRSVLAETSVLAVDLGLRVELVADLDLKVRVAMAGLGLMVQDLAPQEDLERTEGLKSTVDSGLTADWALTTVVKAVDRKEAHRTNLALHVQLSAVHEIQSVLFLPAEVNIQSLCTRSSLHASERV